MEGEEIDHGVELSLWGAGGRWRSVEVEEERISIGNIGVYAHEYSEYRCICICV
jgi:hypothetical protein